MRALSVRRASRCLIPALGLVAMFAVGQTAAATAPPTSPPDSEPTGAAPTDTEPVGTEPTSSEPQALPEGYVWLVDDTGAITVGVPDTWTDVDTTPEIFDPAAAPAPRIAAAPDLTAFRETFDVPGVEYLAAPYTDDPQAIIDEFGLQSGCAELNVEPYEDPVFTGLVQVGTQCGEAGEATWNFVVASPADNSLTALVQVQTATSADDEALSIVLDSFNINPEGGVPGSSVPSSVPGDTATEDTETDDTGTADDTEATETTEGA